MYKGLYIVCRQKKKKMDPIAAYVTKDLAFKRLLDCKRKDMDASYYIKYIKA